MVARTLALLSLQAKVLVALMIPAKVEVALKTVGVSPLERGINLVLNQGEGRGQERKLNICINH